MMNKLMSVVLGSLLLLGRAMAGEGVNWPSFRGPGASGVSEGFKTPETWDAASGKNIKWKTAIPGLAHSSPIVWKDRVFVTTAESENDKQGLKVGLYGDIAPVDENVEYAWKVICLDKKTGKMLWEQVAHKGFPKIKRHPKGSHASSTPATDGKRVVAFFGSEGLYCYDMDGKVMWKKDFGVLDSGYYRVPSAQWGFASSPIIYEDKVIVECDVQKNSFIAVLDANSGQEIWRTGRQEVPTWSSPAVVRSGDTTEIVTNGYKQIAGYDLATGKNIWTMRGGGDIPVPTPIFAEGLIFITNAHGPSAPIFAIRPTAKGDISLEGAQVSNEFVAWSVSRGGNYMQTPIMVGGLLYLCLDNGMHSCYEAKSGRQIYRQRLGDGRTGFTASPIAADGKLYFTSEEGEVYVLASGREFKQLAMNTMGEPCMATPAISEGMLFIRTQKALVAVGN